MIFNLQRKERRKGFLEQSAFVVIDIVLLLLTTGLLIKSLGLVFNPDRQVVTFNTEFLKSKINLACEQGESSLVNFGFPQPTPSKLLGTSDFLAQFSIVGSKSADPHYVLYYESFPPGEAIGWEVYHSNFDTRIIAPFEYSRFNEKFSRPYDPIHPQFITGSDVIGFLEEMDNYTNFIITEATFKGIDLKKTKKPILFNNIILSNSLNVVPQEPATSPTKDITAAIAGLGNAGKWVSYGGNKKFEFSDYLGLTDEERTYIKYRPCADNHLCLKTRDGVEAIKLSDACRGKYFQLFYDARGDTDSIVYAALFGRQAYKVTKDQLDRIEDARIAAQRSEEEAKKAIEALEKFSKEPDVHAKSVERLRELAKNAGAATKAEFESALSSMQSAANDVAEAEIKGDVTAIKAAQGRLDNAAKNMRGPLLKAGAPLADIDVRTGVLKEVSVLDNIKVKKVAVAAEAAKNLKFLRTALRAAIEVGEKSKNVAVKAAKIFPKAVNGICTGVGVVATVFTLGLGGGVAKGACKVGIYATAAAAAGAYIVPKGIEFAKSMIAFALSYKTSDFYLASPCSIEGGSPSIEIKKVSDCSVKPTKDNEPLCVRMQKYPLYKYDENFGSPTIEYRGDHLACMDNTGNNEKIPESTEKMECIRITVKEQKDGFCFTKNPNLVRKNVNIITKLGATTLNGAVDFFAPIWVSVPAQAVGAELPGGFDLDDLTAVAAAWGSLPVNELSSYLPESKAVALAPGELAKGVWDRSKEMVANIVGLSWTWPS
ncbi:MAG: hypothetical protein HY515_03470 [Candidatus Aenigmarchaeota archaeon]|nr:hypothetical protein [Candidatus Aenigmarchaeota archaeon]